MKKPKVCLLGVAVRPTMKGEDRAAARLRVEIAGEARLDAGGFIAERERVTRVGKVFRQTETVLHALFFHPDQRLALFFGLNRADRHFIHEERIICRARFHGEFANSHAAPGGQVEMAAVLYDPAAIFEHPVYILPRAILWSGGHSFSIPAPTSLKMWHSEV